MTRSDTRNIASRIRHAREQAQLDPAAMRTALKQRGIDISKAGLHRLENTEPTNPNLKMIEAIAEVTRVSPAWLLFGKGPTLLPDEASLAIRHRVIDTIELMAGALDMNVRQQKTLDNWLASARAHKPKTIRRP